jgi:hypothetical protein
VGEVEVGVSALECDDTQVLIGVHPHEQILEAFEDGSIQDVKRWIVE